MNLKPFIFLASILLALLCVEQKVKATLPPLPSLEEKVKSSDFIFVGVAEKIKVVEIDPKSLYPRYDNSSGNAPPIPPGLYRRIEVEVRVTDKLKSGKTRLPLKVKAIKTRAFITEKEMHLELDAMKKSLIGKEQIYLVVRNNYFNVESNQRKIKAQAFDRRPTRKKQSCKAEAIEVVATTRSSARARTLRDSAPGSRPARPPRAKRRSPRRRHGRNRRGPRRSIGVPHGG